jgi:hypothetical protein
LMTRCHASTSAGGPIQNTLSQQTAPGTPHAQRQGSTSACSCSHRKPQTCMQGHSSARSNAQPVSVSSPRRRRNTRLRLGPRMLRGAVGSSSMRGAERRLSRQPARMQRGRAALKVAAGLPAVHVAAEALVRRAAAAPRRRGPRLRRSQMQNTSKQ